MNDVFVPSAPDAEQAVLGSLMVDSGLVPIVGKIISREHFHSRGNAALYDVIVQLYERGEPVDKVSVAEELRRRKLLDDVGGLEFLTQLLNSVPTTASAEYYARIVAREYAKRELMDIGNDLVAASQNGIAPSETKKDAQDRLARIQVASRLDDIDAWVWNSQAGVFELGVSPIEWDVLGLFERVGAPTLIIGDAGSFKSWIMLHISACIATGDRAFGRFDVQPRDRALYLNLDAPARAFDKRSAMLGKSVRNLLIASPERFDFDRFKRTLEENPGSWLVADTLADMYAPTPHVEQGADMRAFLKPIRGLYEKHGVGGAIVDHTNRATGDYYGSVQKKATVRGMIRVDKVQVPNQEERTARAKISCVKMSEAEEFRPFFVDLRWTDTAFSVEYAGLADERSTSVAQLDNDLARVLALLSGGGSMTKREIAAGTGMGDNRLRDLLKRPEFRINGNPHSPKASYSLNASTQLETMAEQAGLDLEDPPL